MHFRSENVASRGCGAGGWNLHELLVYFQLELCLRFHFPVTYSFLTRILRSICYCYILTVLQATLLDHSFLSTKFVEQRLG